MHDSELIRLYTLDAAVGIMFVTDLIRDTLTSPTPRRNAIAPEMEINHYINYINIFGNWKNATMQQWWFGSVTTFYKQSDHTNNYSTFRTLVSLLISYKICEVWQHGK